ncbi:cbb3-type cytochrome c oxidase subunit I [Thiomonas sp. FB-6]|uniref:cbb3-type cytochrome c oxidase subunit I n=1 Tax=Thiomonas sp. FB-6 TaxID=1158291 RepID=UPI000379D4A9|nr:cbb3-type cytochrome c oxidase subunit I [Thiomonas sp. FB-6]
MVETHGLGHLLLGRLSLHALPTYSAVAATGAGVAVLGALLSLSLITYLRRWRYLWAEWFTSVDHKRIGIMYIVLALVMLARGVVEGVLMRLQQADAVGRAGFLSPEHFGQLFTTHGTIMIFFMAMPFLIGLMNFVMPLQIGARDVAFPVLNSVSLWFTIGGALIMMVSLVLGKFSTGGWSGYPPYTELSYQPGVGPDYWIWALSLSSLGNLFTGINFTVTIVKLRAPGMRLMDMPLFTWTALCTSILLIYAMPPLTVATVMLALDRYLGMHFFTNGLGGNMMNFPNLFWLFGHPEVYILILPAFGVYSEVIPVFCSKRLYGYTSLVWATMAIALLSFTVWLHHFFTMGQSADINAFFGVATMTIGVPTGVKIYDWLLTMYRGRIRFSVPMLFTLAFLFTFVIGGMTGIILAVPPVDFMVHNTVFLVAHFHNMLIPGVLYGVIAGYQFWFPSAFGFRLDERWGRVAFVCWVAGFYLAFMPLYVLGLEGMPRRSQELFDPSFGPWLMVAGAGAVLLLAGLASLFVQLWVSVRDRELHRVPVGDPWDGRGLEWSLPAPVPEYDFACIPRVHGRDAFMAAKQDGSAYRAPAAYEDIVLPCNSALGPVLGLAGAACAFGLVWHIWWMAAAALLVICGGVIARSFVRATVRIVPAARVAAEQSAWLELAQGSRAITRDEESSPANKGRAEALA